MKKTLAILSSFGLVVTTSASSVSCSWNTPPISVDKISQIFSIVEQEVLTDDENISKLVGDFQTINPREIEKIYGQTDSAKISEAIRNITDPIVLEINQFILNKIQNQQNIITGFIDEQYETQGIEQETLDKLNSEYFTVRIADFLIDDKWMSAKNFNNDSSESWNVVPFKSKDKTLPIHPKNNPVGSGFSLENQNKNIAMALTNNLVKYLNENGKFDNQINQIRYLISINPDGEKFDNAYPIAFYVDVDY